VSAVGSGVGTAAVQIIRALGARAFGTARSADKIERAKALGLIDGVVPDGGRFAATVMRLVGREGVNVVIELVGGAYVAEDLACIAARGRIVVVGLMAGTHADVDLGIVLGKRATIVGTMMRARPLEEKILAARMLEENLGPLIADEKLAAVIDRVLPLEKAREAHTLMASSETFGKIVLEVP
jgi:NADPH:quinone reductase-like Zn-dependent oxidoreductase